MKKRPNIIIIMADDMGYGDVERYNRESLTKTPNINDLVMMMVMPIGEIALQSGFGRLNYFPTAFFENKSIRFL